MTDKQKDYIAFGILVVAYLIFETRTQYLKWRNKYVTSNEANFARATRDQLIAEEMKP